jgi:NAD(P)H dehydrogenase (quinone)
VEKMAEKIKDGLTSAGIEVTLLKAAETDPNDLVDYDGVIFGSPVKMGQVDSGIKSFIDQTGQLWLKAALQNKIGGVFVSGGGRSAGTELTQIGLYSTLMELGMVLVGFVNDMPGYGHGANQWGPYAEVGLDGSQGPSEECLTACYEYGKRLSWAIKTLRK